MVYLYGLMDPITLSLRYVGVTNNLKSRLSGHIWNARHKAKHHKDYWIRKLLEDKRKPIIQELSQFSTKEEAFYYEQIWIAGHRAIGCPLLNVTDGGDGIRDEYGDIGKRIWETRRRNGNDKVSVEGRQRMSEARRGKSLSYDHRRKLCRKITLEHELYIKLNYETKSALELSEILNCDHNSVIKTLDRCGIPSRNKLQVAALAAQKPSFKEKMKNIGLAMASMPKKDRMLKYGSKRRIPKEKQDLIIKLYKENPKLSMRAIANIAETNHHSVRKLLFIEGLREMP